MKKPLVSVVVTVYNEAHVVGAAIDSLLQQTYKPVELIMVDNGSTDTTAAVLRSYGKKIRVVSLKKNAQPGGGRNAGAKAARGTILVFVDADMLFEKTYVAVLTKPIVAGKVVGTLHTQEIVANPENLWARSWCINRIPVEEQHVGCGVYRAVLKEAFFRVGGFDTTKGYFDDDLGQLGLSHPVPARCYHKNPESLREAFKHSLWVGKSLMTDRHAKKKHRPKIILSWFVILFMIALGVFNQFFLLNMILGLSFLFLLLFLAKRTLPRMIQEKRPEYVFSIPILWLVRLTGFYIGAVRQVIRGTNTPD